MLPINPIRFRRQRGQSLLETAVMIVVIIIVVFWVFEVAWLMYTYTVMADAANEGVRYAIVHSGDEAGTKARVKAFATTSLHDTTNIGVNVTFTGSTPPSSVQVSVSYTYVPWLNGLVSTPTMTTYAKGMTIR